MIVPEDASWHGNNHHVSHSLQQEEDNMDVGEENEGIQ